MDNETSVFCKDEPGLFLGMIETTTSTNCSYMPFLHKKKVKTVGKLVECVLTLSMNHATVHDACHNTMVKLIHF